MSSISSSAIPLPIRRIFRHGYEFMCGVCKGHYPSAAEARGCLIECMKEFYQSNLVFAVIQNQKQLFKCKVCRRAHTHVQKAIQCANDCLGILKTKEYKEKAFIGVDFSKVPQKRYQRKRQLSYSELMALKKKADDEAKAKAAKQIAKPVEEVKPIQAVDDGKKYYKPKPDKKWHREGAEYACQMCQAAFYTKIEAEACFDKHPEAEISREEWEKLQAEQHLKQQEQQQEQQKEKAA